MTPESVQEGLLPHDEDSEPAGRPRVFFLTNRYNVIEALSRGYVGPRQAFQKYYADLLELCDGWVPLVAQPFDSALLDIVGAEDETAFPVALELSEPAPWARTMDDQAALADGVIPIRLFKALHFRTEAEQEEFGLRTFENVDSSLLPLKVTPQIFSPQVDHATHEVLAGAGTAANPVTAEMVEARDRASGALAALAAVARPEEADARQLAEALASDGGVEAQWFVGEADPALELELFRTIRRVLSGVALQDWSARKGLQAVSDEVATLKLKSDQRKKVAQHLAAADEVLVGDRDFEGLKPGGIATLKALLVFLLKPQLDRLKGADALQSAGPAETKAAAYFAGFLTGRSMLSADLTTRGLDDFLALREAHALNNGREFAPDISLPEPEVLNAPSESGHNLSIEAGGAELWSVEVPAADPLKLLLDADLSDDRVHSVAVGVARAMKWDKALITTFTLKGPYELRRAGRGADTLVVRGITEGSLRLDADEFRRQLEKLSELPPDVAVDVRTALSDTPES